MALLVWQAYMQCISLSTCWLPNKMRQTMICGEINKIKPGRAVTCMHPLSPCNDGSLQAANTNWWSHFWSGSNCVCVQAENRPLRVTTSHHRSNPTTRPANHLCRHQEWEDKWWWLGGVVGGTFRLPKPVTDQNRKQGLWNMRGHAEPKAETDSLSKGRGDAL